MRSEQTRREALRTLTPEQLRAVSDGRAKVTRSGRLIATAPQSSARHAYAAGVSLTENPNRGKRCAGRLAQLDPVPAARKDYRPLTVYAPLRDSLGRRIGRGRTHSNYTV